VALRIRHVRRSKSWHRKLARVLSKNTPAMHAQIARLVVLYEDMKIEALAASTQRRTFIDYAGKNYRQFYFVRGALQTFREVNSVFAGLESDRDFHRVLGRMSEENKQVWKNAVKFFEANAPAINAVRNVVGGHFSISAGEYAIEHVHAESDARMELRVHRSGKGAGVTFEFATEIVALGLTAKRGDRTQKEYLQALFEMMLAGFGHFAKAMHVLAVEYLIPKFEG
jgi:hypothetical protein